MQYIPIYDIIRYQQYFIIYAAELEQHVMMQMFEEKT